MEQRLTGILVLLVGAAFVLGCGALALEDEPVEFMSLEESLLFIEEQVREIRGIEHSGESAYRLVSPEELEATVRESFDDIDEGEVAEAEFIYSQLGILGPEDDLLQMAEDLLGSQVIGLYEPDTRDLLVRQDAEGTLDIFAASTYAHEYVHFLQDIQFGLDAYRELPEDDEDGESPLTSDELAARTAVVEGDARLTELLYVEQYGAAHPQPEEEPDFGGTDEFNQFLVNDLIFPYTSGLSFANALWLASSLDFTLIDEAYSDPPHSTEEILNPGKYLDEREDPVDLEDFRVMPLGEWSIEDSDVLGEFFISNWLEFLGASDQMAQRGSEGWGGGHFLLLESPDGGRALQWVIAWDNPAADAAEFANALSEGLEESAMFAPSGCLGGAAWANSAGVLAHATMRSAEHGTVSVVAAAAECSQLEGLLP